MSPCGECGETAEDSKSRTEPRPQPADRTCWLLVGIALVACCPGTVGAQSLLMLGDRDVTPPHVYSQVADINLGAIFSIHLSKNDSCSGELRDSGVVQNVEAVAFAIGEINKSPKLLPNTKLGFVIMDDCMKPLNALAQTLHFFPIVDRPNEGCEGECVLGSRRASGNEGRVQPHDFYDVVGVVGAENSVASMIIANVLNIFRIPQISPISTTDLLSNKHNFPYFMRLIPPDRLQVQAILDLIVHFNWTFVAMVHSKGSYGEEAVKSLKHLATEQGVCIGALIAIPSQAERKHFEKIVTDLHEQNAHIVVMFVDQEDAHGVFLATKQLDMIGQFVWIGSDGLGVNMDDFDGVEDATIGTLTLRPYYGEAKKFEQYFEALSPLNNTRNPWLKQLWERLFECKWGETCTGYEKIRNSPDYTTGTIIGNIIDSIFTFAHAIHSVIKDHCEHLAPRHQATCVKGPLLLKYLKKVKFTGITGNISFDENGDVLGRYEILQFRNDSSSASGSKVTRVGIWNKSNRKLTINSSQVVWATHMAINQSVPESLGCGRKCSRGEIYSYRKNTCCWICLPCARNEIPQDGATKCSPCTTLHWPSVDAQSCLLLTPTYLHWHEPLALAFAALSCSGLLGSCVILVIFIRNNGARIIKATSRELSYMMLSGVFVQYFLVFTFISKPNNAVCVFNYVGFNVSFAIVYSSLLTRTNRIFRIFYAGKRTKVMPSLTSPLSQVLIAFILIIVQVIITALSIVVRAPGVAERMPNPLKPNVELTCVLPVQGFVTSLSYNLLLVLVCIVYAFKTRRLPDNFNESRCITLCVYSTLVIWLAFVPTFFMAASADHRVLLTSCALLLNASVTVLCLYAPRICALHAEKAGRTTGSACANTFKYAAPELQDAVVLPGHLETGPTAAAEQGTELSDYCTGFSCKTSE